jgi:hypothetical protein
MAMTDIATGYISRKELAKQVGERLRGKPFSCDTLKGWATEGRGPPVTKVGGVAVYSIKSFEVWLRNQERTTNGT